MTEIERRRCRRALVACSSRRARAGRPAAVRNPAVDGYAVRHADLDPGGETRLKIADRVTAGRAARAPSRRAGDPHLHRRADAGRRRHGVHAGGHPCRGRRGDRRRASSSAPTAALAGEDLRRPIGAAGRTAARAAARGAGRRGRAHRVAGAPPRAGCAVLDRRRDRRAGHAATAGAIVRRQPYLLAGLLERLGAR